jgi:hypothetical protein
MTCMRWCVEWCEVIRRAVMWCGVIWFGPVMIWHGTLAPSGIMCMIRCGMARCCVMWWDVMRCDTMWCDRLRWSMVWYDALRFDMMCCDTIWWGMVWYDEICKDVDVIGCDVLGCDALWCDFAIATAQRKHRWISAHCDHDNYLGHPSYWFDVIWYDEIGSDVVWYEICCYFAWTDSIW